MRWRVKHLFISKDLFDYDPDTTTFEEWVAADIQAGEQINAFYQSLEEQNEFVFSTKMSGYKIKGGYIIVVQAYTTPATIKFNPYKCNLVEVNLQPSNLRIFPQTEDYIEKDKWKGASQWDEQIERLMKDCEKDGV